MIKILPLLLATSFFFIIFFNVKNLTLDNPKNDSQFLDKGLKKDKLDKNNFTDIEQLNSKDKKSVKEISAKDISVDNTNIVDEKIINKNKNKNNTSKNQQNYLMNPEKNKVKAKNQVNDLTVTGTKLNLSDKKNITVNKLSDSKPKNLENPKIKQTEDYSNSIDLSKSISEKIKVQFGAFSKMTNAENHKNKLNDEISIKFPEFKNKLMISKENKFFKVMMFAESELVAKSICNYSKSKNISCLVIVK